MDGEVVYNRRVTEATTRCAAHALLFTFTLLLVLKLDHLFTCAWWRVFSPLWLFHIIFARRRFSIPAPFGLHDFHWPPFHAEVATPLLFAFELLLCVYLEIPHAVNLKIVFLPVVLLEIIIIVDNFRMCFSPMQKERGDSSVNFAWKNISDFLEFILHGSRLLGCWLIDEADPQLLYDCIQPKSFTYTLLLPPLSDYPSSQEYIFFLSYTITFWDNPPGALKKRSKRDLVEEVWTLQVALNDLIMTAKSVEQKHKHLRKKKILCNICSETEIDIVLLPCKHWVVCRSCCIDRKWCPECDYPVNRVIHVLHTL